MSRIITKFILSLVITLIILGCAIETDPNEIQSAQNPPGNSTVSVKTDWISFVSPANRSRADGPVVITGTPNDIERVSITITGDNIVNPIEYDLVKIDNVWQGILVNIPSGPSTVTAKGYDEDDNLIYTSAVDIVIENHETINLNLTLQPVEPPLGYNVKAPRIDLVNISPQKVAPNDPVHLEVYAHDPDPGGPLTYVWTPQDTGIWNDRTSSTPVWTAPAEEGIYQLTITVIDQEFLIDHFTIFIDVDYKYGNGNVEIELGTNNFPIINAIIADPTRINRGESTQLFIDTHDPDGDSITLSWTSDLNGSFDDAGIQNPVFTVGSQVPYGPCILTVQVSDGTLTTTGSIQINITENPQINLSPAVSSAFQSSNRVSPNGLIRYIVRAQDPEGTPLTFSWSANDGVLSSQVDSVDGLEYESTIDWTAPSSGMDPFIISVDIVDAEGLTYTFSFEPVIMQ